MHVLYNRNNVTVFYCKAEYFTVEAPRLYGANIVKFQLASVGQQWDVMGCYLSPENSSTIYNVVTSIIQQPRGGKLMLAGYFNVDLATPEGHSRYKMIASALSTAGFEEMSSHFLQRRKPWLRDGQMCSILRGFMGVYFRTNYILRKDCHLLQNVMVQDAQHNVDH